ncbi:MAG TPA: CAP domain-containing protein [Candidatus Solibacter sp.]|nr:CAP domain-containing protein [Candidatus Solibacter sp.]
MRRATRLLLAFLLATGSVTVHPASRLMASSEAAAPPQKATLKPVSATAAPEPDIPFDDSELQSEQILLQLANQSRQRVGAPALKLDAGLSRAARIHAQAMLDANQLSHQFPGESALAQRLAVMTKLQLDQEGENVALDYTPQAGHEHLMLSPPHRANLLNPAYNVIGLAVLRSGSRLFIVQDFGHALPTYSAGDWKDRVAAAVNQLRRQQHQRDLPRRDLAIADEAACSMAEADKLGTSPVRKLAERYTVLTYTSLHPESLPAEASHPIDSRNLRSFSVGACYARTETYPTGVYWVVLTLD